MLLQHKFFKLISELLLMSFKERFLSELKREMAIKASHISDGKVNEIAMKSLNGRSKNLGNLEAETINDMLRSVGYRPNNGRGGGYVNRNFGYRL